MYILYFKDLGLSHICSGLNEKGDVSGLKTLIIANNNIRVNRISYLTKVIVKNYNFLVFHYILS
jgi:hypothetical protein